MVEFRNGRKQIMYPELFSVDVANTGSCSRLQVPCIPPFLKLQLPPDASHPSLVKAGATSEAPSPSLYIVFIGT